MTRSALAFVAVAALGGACACAPGRAPDKDGPDALSGGGQHEFALPGFDKRPYLLRLPPTYQRGEPLPVVFVLHGGGGHKEAALKLTCPGGDEWSDGCLTALADREGFALVAPSGTGNVLLENVRTWNAGGGQDGWQCVSGDACKNDVDDLAYFDALFTELERAMDVDAARVFATGISNGGAMSHRLACERSMRIAAIASVGGGNQVQEVQGCTPARAVPVMEIHGDEDPCWTFEESTDACAQDDSLKKVGVAGTIGGWVERNGCSSDPSDEELPDTEEDGTRAVRSTHAGCENGAEVVLITVRGGGHTWPGGHGYLGEGTIGRTSRDFSANEAIWSFFEDHPLR